MSLSPGQRLGPYEILSPIGSGGMGEVYKAVDVRLSRHVAIKVLPSELSADPERLRRFEIEARAASALNHPNILTVYDVGESGGVSYIATEFVDGKSLLELLGAGALPLKNLLDLATQTAEGMAAAHEGGIVHRDLKPANLMVSKDGYVKLLDFGLARLEPRPAPGQTGTMQTISATMPGSVLGTAGYMSPEQARGEETDYRSDQFSFGSMLYEMAAGTRAFERGSAIETLSAVLRDEPQPIQKFRDGFPPPLRWVIERCLAKSPADRYTSSRDLARELRGIKDHLSELSGEPVAGRPRRSSRLRNAALAAAAMALAGLLIWIGVSGMSRRSRPPELKKLTFRSGLVSRALFVPKSNSILYTASWDGQPTASYVTLPESKGVDRKLDAPIQLPMAYTADGSEVLVLLGRPTAALNAFGPLAWWPALGGRTRPALEQAGWSDWAPRGRFLAAVRGREGERVLEKLDADGGNAKVLFSTDGAISWVRISPDEKRIAFIHHPSRFDNAGEVRVVGVDGSDGRAVSPRYETCTGLAWNARNGDVWFTATAGSVYSTSLWSAAPKGNGIARRIYSFPDVLVLQDVSGSDCLLVGGSEDTRLFLRKGNQKPANLSWLGSTFVTDISHDRKSVLFIDGTAEEQTLGTWLRPLDGGEAVRVADGEVGRFSPDDQSIVTTTRVAKGTPQVILVTLATGRSVALTKSAAPNSAPSFAGPETVLFSRTAGGKAEIWRTGIDATGERRLASGCDAPSANAEGSAFLCFGGTQDDVLFAAPIPSAGEANLHKVLGLGDGGKFIYARWNANGKEIVAVTNQGRVLVLDPESGAIRREESVPLGDDISARSILTAAFSDDGTVQAYSVGRKSSNLYLFRGL